MKLSITITTFLSVMSVSASPLFGGLSLQKRQVGGVLICTGANQTGDCTHQVYELEKCHQLPKPYYQNVSTFAPDGESFQCYPRTGDCGGICKSPTGCTFGAVDFNYEHKNNLTAIQWNTLFSSFDCFLKTKKSSSLHS